MTMCSVNTYQLAAVQLNMVKAFSAVSNGIPTRELTKLKCITENMKRIDKCSVYLRQAQLLAAYQSRHQR